VCSVVCGSKGDQAAQSSGIRFTTACTPATCKLSTNR
jgi:hypothetical protein